MIKLLTIIFLLSSPLSFSKEFKVNLNKESSQLNITVGKKNHTLDFKLPQDMHVENDIQIFKQDDFNLIFLDLSDYSDASTLIFALNDAGEKLWQMDLGAFNPSPPLIEKNYVYLSAIGKVWKIEKQSGKVLWSHKGLYENKKYDFNGAEEIKRIGAWIQFSQNLQVDDESGKIGKKK